MDIEIDREKFKALADEMDREFERAMDFYEKLTGAPFHIKSVDEDEEPNGKY
jgi:hypothetical protein